LLANRAAQQRIYLLLFVRNQVFRAAKQQKPVLAERFSYLLDLVPARPGGRRWGLLLSFIQRRCVDRFRRRILLQPTLDRGAVNADLAGDDGVG